MPTKKPGAPALTLEVATPTGTVPVAVTRKRVKNMNLRVHRDGRVSLSIPSRTPLALAQNFLDRRANWIATQVARMRTRVDTRAHGDAPAAAPETIPLWGELVNTERALARAGLSLPRPRIRTFGARAERQPARINDLEPQVVDALVRELYRREVARALPDAIARGEARVGVHAAGWQIRHMTSRWGSCTPARRTIRINSALAAYPPECLDYVVVHELTHLLEPSHNARFHALLDRFCPRNREITRLLKRPAAALASGQSERL